MSGAPPRRLPPPLADAVLRARLRAVNRVLTSRTASELVALGWVARDRRAAAPGAPSPALLRAARYTQRPALRRHLRDRLAPQIAAVAARAGAGGVVARAAKECRLPATMVLKAPGANGEKGVLFLANEGQYDLVLAHGVHAALARDYYCVVASAWSPPAYHKFVRAAESGPDPLFVGISNEDDLAGLEILAPWVQPVPLLSADWLNPDDFHPLPRAERDIDVVMVAGWGSYKRHWLLFEALRHMRRDLRVVLVGANNGARTVEHVKAEARAFGVRQDVEFHTALPVQQVYALQCRARIALQLSVREGSCVAVTEAFFADTPVGMMADAHVGTKRHINAETGVLLRHHGLARQVEAFLADADRFAPRAWAARTISYHQSCAALNAQLRRHAEATGKPWTRDIAPFFRRYFTPWYAEPAAAATFAPAADALREQLGVRLR